MMAEFADKQAEWVDPVLAEITRHIMIGWRHSRLFIKMWFKFIFYQTGGAIYEKAGIVSTEYPRIDVD